MKQSALLILNGEPPSKTLLNLYWKQSSLRICADGAANFLYDNGLKPDIIIGDLDSISQETRKYYGESMILHIHDQETTDCEKAIHYCNNRGVDKIVMLGALGERMDHSLYNLGVLKSLLNSEIPITIQTKRERIFLIQDQFTFSEPPGTIVSFLPIFGTVQGVRTKNFQYSINGESLELGMKSSISNRIEKSLASVQIEEGYLLVVVHADAR